MSPRFQPEVFDENLKIVTELEAIAKRKGCTPAQLAIAWIVALSKRDDMPEIFPIPGSTTVERVKENSTAVELSDGEMSDIQVVLDRCLVTGDRFPPQLMKFANS